jgi:putative inorganic carbon (HCO3(-)) transporter
MTVRELAARSAPWLTFGSAVSITLSIAVSQILLGLALLALLLSREPARLPRIKWALGLFILGTLISLAFSPEPAHGLSQIKKFFVFGELLVVYSCLHEMRIVRYIFLTWGGLGAVEAIRGFLQFASKVRAAHAAGMNFYDFYVVSRITGFTSHWNTYSAEEMFAFVMLAAFLLFSPGAAKRTWLWIVLAALAAFAILLSDTRGVWIATFAAAIYLVWFWNRKLVLLLPVAAALAFLVSPQPIRQRFVSIVHPKEEDSNTFRVIAWRAAIQMIEQHPVLGLGPDETKYHFLEYIPADVPRPLPSGFYQHVHNLYLQYAADRGIPTALVYVWMLIQIIVDFSRGLRALPPGRSNRRWLLHGGIAVVLAAMVEGVVEVNLNDTEVLTMFLVAVGCGYLALRKDMVPDESPAR